MNNDFISRLMCVECDNSCPWGDKCGNKVLQKTINIPVEVYELGNGQYGLRSKAVIEPGMIITEYRGEVISSDMMEQRKQYLQASMDERSYFMKFYGNLYLDSKYKGNASRYANHSCDPNSCVYIFNSENFKKAALVSIKAIQMDEPITFSYADQIPKLS